MSTTGDIVNFSLKFFQYMFEYIPHNQKWEELVKMLLEKYPKFVSLNLCHNTRG